MLIPLSPIDIAIIVAYFIVLFGIGLFCVSGKKDIVEYFLMGRRLTLPLFVATLVSSWYGASLAVTELAFSSGIVAWLTQGFFWYIPYLFFAFFLANRIRRLECVTIPEQLGKWFGKKTRTISAILAFFLTSPAPYILSLAIISEILIGWPRPVSVGVCLFFILFYSFRGGFRVVIHADLIQFILMMGGMLLVIPFAIHTYGGFSFLQANVPETHLHLTGGWNIQILLVWGFISLWTLVDPGFYQRCSAAKNSTIPKKGVLISICFWIIFDLCTTTIGLYARAAMPDIDPTTALPVFVSSLLPPVFMGLFFVGLFASIMSTIDSFLLLSTVHLAYDLYGARQTKRNEEKILFATKIALVLTAIIASCLALLFDTVIGIFYALGSIGIGALLVPVLVGFFLPRFHHDRIMFWTMISSSLASFVWMLVGWYRFSDGFPQYIGGIEPMYPGIGISLVVYFFIFSIRSFFNEKKRKEKPLK